MWSSRPKRRWPLARVVARARHPAALVAGPPRECALALVNPAEHCPGASAEVRALHALAGSLCEVCGGYGVPLGSARP